jgi:hypothetical protein
VFIFIQFQDVGSHGTKVIVYNLWMNDDGLLELDFEDDDEVSVHIIFIARPLHVLHFVWFHLSYQNSHNVRNVIYVCRL